MKCSTCSRTRLTLTTTSDGVTHCYPCLALDGDPTIGRTFVPADVVQPWRGWGIGESAGMTWAEVKTAVAGGASRAEIREP